VAKTLPWLAIAGALVAGTLMAAAGSSHGVEIAGVPAFAVLIAAAFAVQWIAFIPAWFLQTERFFDVTGSVTFLIVTLGAFEIREAPGTRSLLIAALIALWALRLGLFLFLRVSRDGEDRRFRQIKPNFSVFLMTWTLQGLWVSFTAAPALAALLASHDKAPDWTLALGAALWLGGFLIETVADGQKTRFRAVPENRDRYITSGLWAWSRHPNYFGEILLWIGIAVIAAPLLQGWQLATLVSPVFVWLLLTRISGVRMLEARANRRWRDDPGYQDYVRRTNALLLRPPRRT
jgi:steroid 5-alpha reductase family enzyme